MLNSVRSAGHRKHENTGLALRKRKGAVHFMQRLYEFTGGSTSKVGSAHDLGAESGWTDEETDAVGRVLGRGTSA